MIIHLHVLTSQHINTDGLMRSSRSRTFPTKHLPQMFPIITDRVNSTTETIKYCKIICFVAQSSQSKVVPQLLPAKVESILKQVSQLSSTRPLSHTWNTERQHTTHARSPWRPLVSSLKGYQTTKTKYKHCC